MKIASFLFLILFLLAACSKNGSKGSFKLIIGQEVTDVPMSGGAYVETEDLSNGQKALIGLDAENSAVIPLGTYNLLFVTFLGPLKHSGIMYCGSVSKANLLSSTATISVSVTEASCSESIYSELIIKIVGNSNSIWDSAKFDQGKWGP